MKPLPQDFLNNIATEYSLSKEQKEIFVKLYNGQDKVTIIKQIHLSESAFNTRMTGVYRKFNFGGKGRNKQLKLYDWLRDKYELLMQPESSQANLNEDQKEQSKLSNLLEREYKKYQKEVSTQLVPKIRYQIKEDIKNRCGKMQVLDMTQSIGLDDIYTQVNIAILNRLWQRNIVYL